MSIKWLEVNKILPWACQYLIDQSQRAFKYEFYDGQIISELIHEFYPSIQTQNYSELKPKMHTNLSYIKTFLQNNNIPIDFDIQKVPAQSKYDKLMLLNALMQHFESNHEQIAQKKKQQNVVQQEQNRRNVQPSPIRQNHRLHQSNLQYPPQKSYPRQSQNSHQNERFSGSQQALKALTQSRAAPIQIRFIYNF